MTCHPLLRLLSVTLDSKKCMTHTCEDCACNAHLYKPKISDANSSSITYFQWQDGEKVEIPATTEDALHELQWMVPSFLVHVYEKRAQASFFENVKESGWSSCGKWIIQRTQH